MFIFFISAERENLSTLFYIYVRQYLKILENINFRQLHQTKKSPLEITLKYSSGESILLESIYDDKIT